MCTASSDHATDLFDGGKVTARDFAPWIKCSWRRKAACPGPELHHSAGPRSHVTGIDPEMQELFRGAT